MGKSIFAIGGVLLLFVVSAVGFFSLMADGLNVQNSQTPETQNQFVAQNSLENTDALVQDASTDIDDSDNKLAPDEPVLKEQPVFGERKKSVEATNVSTAPEPPNETETSRTTARTNAVLTINDIPDQSESQQLVSLWTNKFGKSVAEKDFKRFHDSLAEEFKTNFSLNSFTDVFSSFIVNETNLKWVDGVSPTLLRKPAIDADGVLTLNGYFPAQPRVNFNYDFVLEDSQWKPVGIDIRLPENNGEIVLPKPAELKSMVTIATKDFGSAVRNRDFSKLHKETYSKFQEKFSIQQFRDYFGSFVEKEADLKWLNGIEPVFDSPPSINLNGFLNLAGHFPAEPVVNFKYAFVKEDSKWKISAINIAIPPADEDDETVAEQ